MPRGTPVLLALGLCQSVDPPPGGVDQAMVGSAVGVGAGVKVAGSDQVDVRDDRRLWRSLAYSVEHDATM